MRSCEFHSGQVEDLSEFALGTLLELVLFFEIFVQELFIFGEIQHGLQSLLLFAHIDVFKALIYALNSMLLQPQLGKPQLIIH